MPSSVEQQHVAELVEQPGYKIMYERAAQAREDYYANLARTLYTNPGKIGEADLYGKQMFFRGVMWALNNPLFEMKALERELARSRDEETEQ